MDMLQHKHILQCFRVAQFAVKNPSEGEHNSLTDRQDGHCVGSKVSLIIKDEVMSADQLSADCWDRFFWCQHAPFLKRYSLCFQELQDTEHSFIPFEVMDQAFCMSDKIVMVTSLSQDVEFQLIYPSTYLDTQLFLGHGACLHNSRITRPPPPSSFPLPSPPRPRSPASP